MKGNHFSIEWDNPIYLEKTGDIQLYRIYMRRHGWYNWKKLNEIVYSMSPSYTITRGAFPPGKYDIGVSVVTRNGIESGIHSSMDNDASPRSGWYIFWIMD